MCKIPYRPCLNVSCNGFAETLDLIPCENRPNCQIEYQRLPRNRRSGEVRCPNCRGLTKQQRKNQTSKARYAANKAKAESSKAQEGKIIGAGHVAPAEVGQHGESSTMALSSGVVGGGLRSNFENRVSTSEDPEETEELDDPSLPAEEDDLGRPNLTGSLQNEERMELESGSDEAMVDTDANEEHPLTYTFPDFTQGSPSLPPEEDEEDDLGGPNLTGSLQNEERMELESGSDEAMVDTAANEEHPLTSTLPDVTHGSPTLVPEEDSDLRPNLAGSLQNEERTELGSGSDEPTVDTPANEEYSLTNTYLVVRDGSQAFSFGAGAPIPIDPAVLHPEDIESYPYPVGPVRTIQEAEQDLRDIGFLF